MPNLENLKEQAKLTLRWHRERHYPVAAQIRGLMPLFLNMPDSEILAMPKNSRSDEGAAEDVIEIVRTYLK